MKKILVSDKGELILSEVAHPELRDDEIEIKAEAIGVNFADIKIRYGYYPDKSRRNPEMGSEIAGVVTKTGRDAHRFSVGEKVVAVSHWGGGYAEYTVVPESSAFRLPVFLSFQEGAAFPSVTQTAYHLVHLVGRIQQGETTLIHAAGGGVGTMLVQLCKLQGAKIIALSSSNERLEKVKSLGADCTLTYADEIEEEISKFTNKIGVDVIFDGNGGEAFSKNFERLAMRGRVILFGNSAGNIPEMNPYQLVYSSYQLLGFSMRAVTAQPELYHETYQKILKLIELKKLTIEIGHRISLADAPLAHDLLQTRKNYGKIVLIP